VRCSCVMVLVGKKGEKEEKRSREARKKKN
jgi:hypothetical protein